MYIIIITCLTFNRIPNSEGCNGGRDVPTEMSFNMAELLQPLERLRIYSTPKRPQPSPEASSDPASMHPEAPSTQPCPEVYVGKYDYTATDSDQLSFKKGDLITVLSKEEEWWSAQLQSTGERGKIPSNFVVEKNSLEAEE